MRRAGLGAVIAALLASAAGCGLPPTLDEDELVSRLSAVDGVSSPSYDAKDPHPEIRVSMDPRTDAQTLGAAGREITALLTDHRHRPKHPHVVAWRGAVTAEFGPAEDGEDWEPAPLPLEQMAHLDALTAVFCAALGGTSDAPAATVVPELSPLDWQPMALTTAARDSGPAVPATAEPSAAGAAPLSTPGALVVTTVPQDAFACGGGADAFEAGVFASDGIPLTRAAERIVVDHGHPQALAQLTALREAVAPAGRIVEARIGTTEEGAPAHPTEVRIVVDSADALAEIDARLAESFGPHAPVIAEAVAESGEPLLP